MNIYIDIYGIKAKIFTENNSLYDMIVKYYEPFLVSELKGLDLDIILERYSYFGKKKYFKIGKEYVSYGADVKIDTSGKYYFSQQEISGIIDYTNKDKIQVHGKLIPHSLRHWINIGLQGFTRIDKYYNRFIIKTCIHDLVFILLEKKLNSCLLHATAVSNGKKTFLFTGLGGSGKSTMASAFSKLKGYTILSDNYAIVSEDKIYPFPELPRITKGTQKLLRMNLSKKADGTKNYLENNLENIKKSYIIDKIFICSYSNNFSIQKIEDQEYIFELLFSINNYTKEFPEYLNLALLSIMNKFNTNKQRILSLDKIIEKNNFYFLDNNENIDNNINEILNV